MIIPVPLQVPPEVAAVKFTVAALTHKEEDGVIVASELGVTVTKAVSIFPQAPLIVYVIVNVPMPDVAGSNVPLTPDVIPVPVHVPPIVAELKLKDGVPTQIGVTLVIVASSSGVIFIVTVEDDAAQGALSIVH